MLKNKKIIFILTSLIIAVSAAVLLANFSDTVSLSADVQNTEGQITSIQLIGGQIITPIVTADDLGFLAPGESPSFRVESDISLEGSSTSFQVTPSSEGCSSSEGNLADEAPSLEEDQETEAQMHAVAQAGIFSDLDSGHWSYRFVVDLYNREVLDGYPDKTFRPNNPINRAELTKIAAAAFADYLKQPSGIKYFSDVHGYDWFAPFIYKLGLSGYSDSTFRPAGSATRAEALAALLTAGDIDLADCPDSNFRDVKNTDWFAPFANCALAKKIIQGYEIKPPSGVAADSVYEFRPHQLITRAEVSAMASSLLTFKESN